MEEMTAVELGCWRRHGGHCHMAAFPRLPHPLVESKIIRFFSKGFQMEYKAMVHTTYNAQKRHQMGFFFSLLFGPPEAKSGGTN
jgi:hypothetical protein